MRVKLTVFSKQVGMSILEVLISLGILSTVSLAMMSFLSAQSKEVKALQEVLAKTDLESAIIKTFSTSGICTFVLNDPSQSPTATLPNRSTDTIDTTSAATLAAAKIQVQRVPASASSSPLIIAQVGGLASVNSNSLRISSMVFKNFTNNGVNQYLVDFEINFDANSSVRPLKPLVYKNIFVNTKASDPVNAKSIIECNAPRGSAPKMTRYSFDTPGTYSWTVPNGVNSAFVSLAGGGGSGMGWRISNVIKSGDSGGFVSLYPLNLIPGETLTVIVGTGGASYQPIKTSTAASPGPPFYIYTNPSDDGLGGYPGTSSKIVSPTAGLLIECAGGSGGSSGGIDNYSGTPVAGNLSGATYGSGSPTITAPNRVAAGSFAQSNGPGKCGNGAGSIVGYGTQGNQYFSLSTSLNSGTWSGGRTPFGNGSGGNISVTGCYVTATLVGTCIHPLPGKDGVVYIDVLY